MVQFFWRFKWNLCFLVGGVRFVAGFLYVTLLREHIPLLEAQFRLLLVCTLIRLIEAAAFLFPPVCGQGRREQHHGVTGLDPQRLRPCCSGRLAGSSLSTWCHCTSLESHLFQLKDRWRERWTHSLQTGPFYGAELVKSDPASVEWWLPCFLSCAFIYNLVSFGCLSALWPQGPFVLSECKYENIWVLWLYINCCCGSEILFTPIHSRKWHHVSCSSNMKMLQNVAPAGPRGKGAGIPVGNYSLLRTFKVLLAGSGLHRHCFHSLSHWRFFCAKLKLEPTVMRSAVPLLKPLVPSGTLLSSRWCWPLTVWMIYELGEGRTLLTVSCSAPTVF